MAVQFDLFQAVKKHLLFVTISKLLKNCDFIFVRKLKQDNRYLYLVTNNDEPHPNFSDYQKQANRRVADFEDANIILTLFPIGTHFDGSKFYQVLISNASDR